MANAALCASLLVSAGASATAGDEATGTTRIYHGARVIDGTGAPAREGLSIVVRDGRIVALVPDADAPDGEHIDVRGLHALPGLIDTHVHLATPPDTARAEALLRRQLYGGVTTVRSMADDLRAVGELARRSRVGEIPAPDIVYAALMAGPGFFDDPRTAAVSRGGVPGQVPWMQAIDEDTDLPLAVAMARGTSAGGIKLYADLPAAVVARITAEAHRQGVPVWAHAAVFPAMPAEVVRAGVDVLSHVCPLGYEVSGYQPQAYRDPAPVDASAFEDGMPEAMVALFADMAARGTVLDATNRVYVEHVRQYARDGLGRPPRCDVELTYRLSRQAYHQGVAISAGTDGETEADAPFPALHDELEILAGPVGMTPEDVIAAATRVAARALGQEAEIGTLAPGKLANLVFVAGDPLQDVAHLREVVLTVKRGVPYPRSDYVPVAGQVPVAAD
ncbi:amidohydrolase family protein [Luteimonas sp. BDR2-5]|uniref:amidohydrolase family protein n=1 Tax=Proluteimonas luteida TaxID=2878685 RepID=UPI001E642242|nr:amidohydrolase family protein [Luteimonas sp. BDR2-5]MCD9028678.1 amidohydrolase family protein [Luteimonas sp. BDR2-5]